MGIGIFAEPQLRLRLGLLIYIPRIDGILLVCGRILDVTVNANGRYVNESYKIRSASRRLSEQMGALDMHIPIIAVLDLRLPKSR